MTFRGFESFAWLSSVLSIDVGGRFHAGATWHFPFELDGLNDALLRYQRTGEIWWP